MLLIKVFLFRVALLHCPYSEFEQGKKCLMMPLGYIIFTKINILKSVDSFCALTGTRFN